MLKYCEVLSVCLFILYRVLWSWDNLKQLGFDGFFFLMETNPNLIDFLSATIFRNYLQEGPENKVPKEYVEIVEMQTLSC